MEDRFIKVTVNRPFAEQILVRKWCVDNLGPHDWKSPQNRLIKHVRKKNSRPMGEMLSAEYYIVRAKALQFKLLWA